MDSAATGRTSDEKRIAYTQKAAAVFAKKGFHQCGVVELARELGLSKGGFYWYFPSKTDLYVQVCQLFCAEHQQVFISLLADRNLNAGSLLDVSLNLLQSLLTDPLHLGLMLDFYSETPRQPAIREALSQLDQKWEEIIVNVILRLQQSGYIKSGHDARELALRSRALFTGLTLQFAIHRNIDLTLNLWTEYIKDLERQDP